MYLLMLDAMAELMNKLLSVEKTTPAFMQLENRVLQLIIRPLPQPLYLFVQGGRVAFRTATLDADVTIQGHVVDWIRLLLAPQENVHALLQHRFCITGDVLLAQQIKMLIDELHIDWESFLAGWTGDFLAYQFSQFIRHWRPWCRHKQDSLIFQLSNFLQEEIKLIPVHEAVTDFYDEIDELVLAVERLEAKLMVRSS